MVSMAHRPLLEAPRIFTVSHATFQLVNDLNPMSQIQRIEIRASHLGSSGSVPLRSLPSSTTPHSDNRPLGKPTLKKTNWRMPNCTGFELVGSVPWASKNSRIKNCRPEGFTQEYPVYGCFN